MLSPITPTEGTATAQLRGRNRPSAGFGINRVKDGFTLGALRASGGPPASAAAKTDRPVGAVSGIASQGRRSTTLFDRSRSGQGVLDRLRGQVRSVSPLTAGLSGGRNATAAEASDPSAPAIAVVNKAASTAGAESAPETTRSALVTPGPATDRPEAAESAAPSAADREERRLSIFVAQQSSLRLNFQRTDNSSRFLLAQSNSRRTQLGYGLQKTEESSQFGGGLSLRGGGISLFG